MWLPTLRASISRRGLVARPLAPVAAVDGGVWCQCPPCPVPAPHGALGTGNHKLPMFPPSWNAQSSVAHAEMAIWSMRPTQLFVQILAGFAELKSSARARSAALVCVHGPSESRVFLERLVSQNVSFLSMQLCPSRCCWVLWTLLSSLQGCVGHQQPSSGPAWCHWG